MIVPIVKVHHEEICRSRGVCIDHRDLGLGFPKRRPSSEIRQELSKGGTPSDLPPAVADYIHARGLYRIPAD